MKVLRSHIIFKDINLGSRWQINDFGRVATKSGLIIAISSLEVACLIMSTTNVSGGPQSALPWCIAVLRSRFWSSSSLDGRQTEDFVCSLVDLTIVPFDRTEAFSGSDESIDSPLGDFMNNAV